MKERILIIEDERPMRTALQDRLVAQGYRVLTEAEVDEHYEHATGVAITECFAERDPVAIPGVLPHYHAPFTWGLTPQKALDNAVALEMCAEMAVAQLLAGCELTPIPEHLLRKHYTRKHGPDATYGQRSSRRDTERTSEPREE